MKLLKKGGNKMKLERMFEIETNDIRMAGRESL